VEHQSIRILLVEDNIGDARLIEVLLEEEAGGEFDVRHVDRLRTAMDELARDHFDVVLLDLSLPDSHGLETVEALRRHSSLVPIVILSGLDDEDVALRAVQAGAQDYLVKGRADGNLIKRAVLYAIERHRIRREASLTEAVFEATDTGIIVADTEGRIMRVNPAFTRLTGFAESEVIGGEAHMLGSGETEADYHRVIWSRIDPRHGWEGEVWNRRQSGDLYPVWARINAVHDDLGGLSGFVVVLSDITHRKRAEEELRWQATRDSLTGLANRSLFMTMLGEAVENSAGCGLLFVDLDGFKAVNDDFGHDAGDAVLKEVARRLRAAVRASDEVARLAGDEFVIVLNDVRQIEDAVRVAAKVVDVLAVPYPVEGDPTRSIDGISASVGIALCPADASSADGLLRAADAAMYRAKRGGKNRWCRFLRDLPQGGGDADDVATVGDGG
jgi:diguanylate cyclase (GGDEF)-like protein/PAS domain S-box-containing protein